ncbi:hypothetical protein SCHPADRAFT_828048 [Schizopora paradoxa]|uniref:AB hydrolase-1 domain-containing protein n=1 Tax=Schizopora paradoxa TaxID=27342 RepID=A0A0H2RP50_9AGAM|nr:hypothetical protein SCHPADRAFT_828048 [Schizopora paradoxa]
MPSWLKAVLNVDDDGDKEFAFLDSGSPGGDAYKTLAFVHGHTYHSNVFSRLFPLAANYNLRIIAVNRRDYVGSSPFSQTELDDLHCDDVDRLKAFMRMRGLEIAAFLVWAIRELELPLKDETGRPGLSLIGWSLGNITTMAFLCYAATYPPEVIQTLEKYLGGLYIYDFAYNGMGYESPPGAYHPLTSTKVHSKDTPTIFHDFIWTYYQHPSLEERKLSDLHMKPPEGDEHTKSFFSPEELAACTDKTPANRSEIQFYPTHKAITPVLRDQFKNTVLLDSHCTLSHLNVRFLACTATIWTILWGMWVAEEEVNQWKVKGESMRPVTFEWANGENHFVSILLSPALPSPQSDFKTKFHYDHPIEFLKRFSIRHNISG